MLGIFDAISKKNFFEKKIGGNWAEYFLGFIASEKSRQKMNPSAGPGCGAHGQCVEQPGFDVESGRKAGMKDKQIKLHLDVSHIFITNGCAVEKKTLSAAPARRCRVHRGALGGGDSHVRLHTSHCEPIGGPQLSNRSPLPPPPTPPHPIIKT